MSRYFTITDGTEADRRRIAAFLPHLDRVSPALAEKTITAWLTVWRSSAYERPEDFPYTLLAPTYRLMDHIAEVAELGVLLAEYRERRWHEPFDPEVLVPTMLLHDVDKPLLYEPKDGAVVASALAGEVPHGVLGGILLHELGFDERVVSIVSTHAANAPFHSSRDEGWILHYADFYSCDHALRTHGEPGAVPFYQRHLA
jgi:putative nucleotidyltransferase with HDIG domain